MTESQKNLVTIGIPRHLEELLAAAHTRITITHNDCPESEALLLALIERGARAVLNGSVAKDERQVGSLTVAELADLLGVLDLHATRESARKMRAHYEEIAKLVAARVREVQGLSHVALTNRLADAASIRALADEVVGHLEGTEHKGVIMAIAYVDGPDATDDVSGPASNLVH